MLGCLALTKIAVVPENNLKIGEEGGIACIIAGAQITCFTGTKVQILTQKLVEQAGGLGRKWRRGVVSAQTAAAVGLQMQART